MGVVACNSREFLADRRGEGLFRAGDEDSRGEVDWGGIRQIRGLRKGYGRHTLRPLSASSTDGVRDVELLCLAEDYTWTERSLRGCDTVLTLGEI